MTSMPARDTLFGDKKNHQSVTGAGNEHRRFGRAADLDDLVELLSRRLGDRVAADEVAACLATAVAQLAGSVHSQDLPEMAFQLAMIRLATAAGTPTADRSEPVPSS